MRENGEYQLQFLKTRSSSAVGQKIKLKFRNDCLLILDPDDDEAAQAMIPKTPAQIVQELKLKPDTEVQMTPVPDGSGSTSQRIMDLMKKARGE
jgi:hypothetical protein